MIKQPFAKFLEKKYTYVILVGSPFFWMESSKQKCMIHFLKAIFDSSFGKWN